MTEEGTKVPAAAATTGIPRSTVYELLKVWNESDGSVYPKGCKMRASKKKADTLEGNTKLEEKHTLHLIGLVNENPCIIVADAKDLCSKFSELSILASGLSKHMKAKCGLSLKKS